MRGLVAEDGAVDPSLAAVIDELSPDPQGIGSLGSQDDLLTRTDEQLALPSVGVPIGRVVPFVEFEAVKVAILCQPPISHTTGQNP